jgi:peptide/nickel transport system permease protein
MYQFIIQRLLQALATIIVVSIVVFLFVHLSGDPSALLLPDQATPEDIARLGDPLLLGSGHTPTHPRLGEHALRCP